MGDGKLVKKKRAMLRTFLWPGWGHLVIGKRKKGWIIWGMSLVGLLIIICGMAILLLRIYAAPLGEEVQIDQTGVIIMQDEEEAEDEEEPFFAPLVLPLIIVVIGLAIRSSGGIVAYKDIKKLPKEKL